MVGIETVIHIGKGALHQRMIQSVGVVKADSLTPRGLDSGQHLLCHTPQCGMHQIVSSGEGHILIVEYDVFQHALNVLSMHPVISVHIHVGNGCLTVSDLQVADIQSLRGQGVQHPGSVFVGAGGADDCCRNPQFLQVHAGVHAVPGGITAVDLLAIDAHIDINAVVSNHCRIHVFIPHIYFRRSYGLSAPQL